MWYKAFVHVADRARCKRLLSEAMPYDLALGIDRRLAALGRGLGAMRLWLGEGLARLEACGGVMALGFPTLGSYAQEALGMTGRQAGDARALARRLTGLPGVRAALIDGRLSWSKVELLVRVATPEDEGAWVERAEGLTVRQLRVLVTPDPVAEELSDGQEPVAPFPLSDGREPVAPFPLSDGREPVAPFPLSDGREPVAPSSLSDGQEPVAPSSRGEVGAIAREPLTTLMITVDRLDAMAFEGARMMVQALGARGVDGAVEAILAEGLSEMVACVPDLDLPSGIGGLSDEARAWREELMRMRREGEEVCEAQGFGGEREIERLPLSEPVWPGDGQEPVAPSSFDVVGAFDRMLRGLAGEIAGRDLALGQLARRSFESDAWRRLGYATFEQYARERIGLSASSVAAKIALARDVAWLPEVEDALVSGRIGACAAGLVARVAGPSTAKAWVERAEVRTVKHLREEVEAVELLARAEGREAWRFEPPDEALVEEVHDVERAVIAALTDGVQMSVSREGDERGDGAGLQMSVSREGDERGDGAGLQMSVSVDGDDRDDQASVRTDERVGVLDLPTRTLRLRVSEDTARFWRALERVHAGLWTGTSFVAFLARAVAKSWAGAIDRNAAGGEYADVYVRDRWRCRSPVCDDRNLTPHHVRFRSRGGGEGRDNIVGACARCHLELVHGNVLSVVGDASVGGALTWEAAGFRVVGRQAVVRVGGVGVGGVGVGVGRGG